MISRDANFACSCLKEVGDGVCECVTLELIRTEQVKKGTWLCRLSLCATSMNVLYHMEIGNNDLPLFEKMRKQFLYKSFF